MNNPILQTKDLFFSYGSTPVLNGLDLSFEKGQITAILGPNGCGKTTLLRCLNGLLKPQQGSILLDGSEEISTCSGKALAKRISFLPQNRPVPDIPVEMLVSHGRFPHLGFSRKLTAADRVMVQKAMAAAGIEDLTQRAVPTLSGGERQRVYIAMLLAQDTDIILLDEPTTYLDARHKFEVMALLRAMRDNGKTVIPVLHDLPLALSCCDRLILLENGVCAASGAPASVYETGALDRVFGIRLRRTVLDGQAVYVEQPNR